MSEMQDPNDSSNGGVDPAFDAHYPAGSPLTPMPVTPSAGAEAEGFLRVELAEARRSLMLTRVTSVVFALFFACYLAYVTHRFTDSLQPRNAAEIAHGIIAQKVEDQAPQIADNIKARVPAMIEQIPDYAMQQIPQYRRQLQDKIAGDLATYAGSTSKQLGSHLDDFLAAHKEEVGQMIDDGQDPALTAKVGADLEHEFVLYLRQIPAGGGESYQSKLDQSLAILDDTQSEDGPTGQWHEPDSRRAEGATCGRHPGYWNQLAGRADHGAKNRRIVAILA